MPCALAPATSDGLTRALETAVYLETRRRASSRVGSIALLKLKSGKEIDFIEGDEAFGIAYELIQVSLNMENEATRQREVSALQEAMSRFEKDAATIVTLDEELNKELTSLAKKDTIIYIRVCMYALLFPQG